MSVVPVVSVIMAVFNGDKYLKEAIDSIIAQSFLNFEFIVIDDGSSDETLNIISQYSDERLVVISRSNIGLPLSLNEAIDLARGEFIARMDADDVALPNRLELQLNYMMRNPGVGILGGQAYLVDGASGVVGVARKPTTSSNVNQYLMYSCPVLHPSYFVRKEVYDSLDGYRDIPVEDYDFLFRAYEKNIIIENLPDFVIYYRHCQNGLSLSNPYKTMVLTSWVKKMSVLRRRSLSDDDVFSKFKTFNKKPIWFGMVFNWRLSLISMRQKKSGFLFHIISLVLVVVSCLHFRILLNSYSVYRASKCV